MFNSGHAYARAIRAHFLTQWSLINHLLKNISGANNALQEELRDLHDALFDNSNVPNVQSESLNEMCTILNNCLADRKSLSDTGKLWVRYIELIHIVQKFILAEKTSDWDLHLKCVAQMIPFFYAAGHFNYAKSAHLYLQEMLSLSTKMPEKDYYDFITQNFTIRRTNSFWAATFSDMAIEQYLMRSLKSQGGITHGRGTSESVLSKWVLSIPETQRVIDSMEEFAHVFGVTTDQHIELRASRMKRDEADLQKFIAWFDLHSPFITDEKRLQSLSNGNIADVDVNCQNAFEIGVNAIKSNIGKNFSSVKVSRKYKVKTIDAIRSDKLATKEVVNTHQIFNRIVCSNKSGFDLKECFNHELSSFPPSLFDEKGFLRKSSKSVLIKHLQLTPVSDIPSNVFVIIDGGLLLHCVVWPKLATFEDIFQMYVDYIERKYRENVEIVFDGYENHGTVKDEEHRRRQKRIFPEIKFNNNTKITFSQHDFLVNKKNKVSMNLFSISYSTFNAIYHLIYFRLNLLGILISFYHQNALKPL